MGEQEERQARFERLYDQASLQVLGYALRRADSPEDAADVVSETFMIAWRRLDEVPAGDEARLWLYGVARRVLANQRRGQQRRERLNARLRDEVAVVSARAEAERPAPNSAVMAALSRLDEADRELITLVAWEGLDRDQIATMLGCSRATIRVRLHRARRRLARLLGEEDHHGPQPSPSTSIQSTSTQSTAIPLPAQHDGHERFSALAGTREERREAR
jgi:RNA polymerase sigma factor (sigma-70 family)